MSNIYTKYLNDLFLALEDTLDEVQRNDEDILKEHKLLSQLEIVGNIIKEFKELQPIIWEQYIKELQEKALKDYEYIITLRTYKNHDLYIAPDDVIKEENGILHISNRNGEYYINCYDITSVKMELE